MPLPVDLNADKHGYLLFDCPDCRRTAKLQRAVAEARYRAETSMAPIVGMVRPNDCKSERCGLRVRP
jgi:hypothetical protein